MNPVRHLNTDQVSPGKVPEESYTSLVRQSILQLLIGFSSPAWEVA